MFLEILAMNTKRTRRAKTIHLKIVLFRPHMNSYDLISISSGQRNLMKTYHNDTNTSGITKIALKKNFELFLTKKMDSQNCKNLTFKVIFLRQKLSKSLRKKTSLKNINLGQQLLLKSFFDKFNFKSNL